MKIGVVAMVRNEQTIMPWFLRHYTAIADEIVIFDNQSDDLTKEVICACPKVVLKDVDFGPGYQTAPQTTLKSFFYRTRGWDWALVVDSDEFVYHPDLRGYLQRCIKVGVTVPLVTGWEMVGERLPEDDGASQIWELVREGVSDSHYAKYCVLFRTVRIRYGLGCHMPHTTFEDSVKFSSDCVVKVLHYKWLDRVETLGRFVKWQDRLDERDRKQGLSVRDPVLQERRYNWLLATKKRVL